MAEVIHISNRYYSLAVDTRFGKLLRLTDIIGGFELINEPRLSENFRLLLSLPGVDCNYILGREQQLTSYEVTDGSLKLIWQGPLKNEYGEFDLDVTIWIELVEEAVQFRCEVRNDTAYTLSEVWYAMIGGMRGLGEGEKGRSTMALLPRTMCTLNLPIFSDFVCTRGEILGVTGVEQSYFYPGELCMPWISIYNPRLSRALYVGALEETPRVKLLRFYLEPGIANDRPGGNWPQPEEVGDLPLGIMMNWVHVPYTKPGDTFTSAPVIVQCHDGGWRESAVLFRNWFTAHFPVVEPGSGWMRTETAALDTMFLLPEDNVNVTFAQIQAWAKTAKERGITHVMISGWHLGGHDRGYPQYSPDPRLGTWEELAAGIHAIHEMGMKVSFFVNCQPVDMTTEWYSDELQQYRILNPYGEHYFTSSWGMGTLSARTRFFTARPMTDINPAHPAVREMLIRQFVKLVEIGADGIHIDKLNQTPMDFNPRLTWTSPDRALHEGILLFVEELLAACRAINPDFSFSYEGGWDRLFSYADIEWWGGGDDALKAVFPQQALTVAVSQPYDFQRVNNAVLSGCHLLIGPGNYTKSMDYPPMQKLLAYVQEINSIRQELLTLVSFGEIIDRSEGIFRRQNPILQIAGSFAEDCNAHWSVFRDINTGKRAAVLGNQGAGLLRAEDIHFADTPSGHCHIYQAFALPRVAAFPFALDIPAEQVVFLVEA